MSSIINAFSQKKKKQNSTRWDELASGKKQGRTGKEQDGNGPIYMESNPVIIFFNVYSEFEYAQGSNICLGFEFLFGYLLSTQSAYIVKFNIYMNKISLLSSSPKR